MPIEPISSAGLHILLALADGERHGLGIAEWVEEATGGVVELGPGTLYRTLKELSEDRLIRETEPREAVDPRRKYYAITAAGRRRAAAEAARLERLVEVARARKLLPERAW